jgi:hypothetical protein
MGGDVREDAISERDMHEQVDVAKSLILTCV